jgi:hypothetical protein
MQNVRTDVLTYVPVVFPFYSRDGNQQPSSVINEMFWIIFLFFTGHEQIVQN